jgi:hypothetical protein
MTQPIHQTNASGRRQNGRRSAVRKTAFLLMTLVTTDVSAQQKPTTGYAPVNGINMYYEVHGGGEPSNDDPRRGSQAGSSKSFSMN